MRRSLIDIISTKMIPDKHRSDNEKAKLTRTNTISTNVIFHQRRADDEKAKLTRIGTISTKIIADQPRADDEKVKFLAFREPTMDLGGLLGLIIAIESSTTNGRGEKAFTHDLICSEIARPRLLPRA